MSAALMPQKKKKDAWFKEPWLLLVAGGPLVVVCASLYTGFVAFGGADKVVAEDYYKQGLMINKDIQRDAKARELHLSANLILDPVESKIKLKLAGDGELPAAVQLSLANAVPDHNSVTEVVHRLSLKQTTPGNYEGEFKIFSNLASSSVKLFHIKLETTAWRLTGDWFEPGQKAKQLVAEK